MIKTTLRPSISECEPWKHDTMILFLHPLLGLWNIAVLLFLQVHVLRERGCSMVGGWAGGCSFYTLKVTDWKWSFFGTTIWSCTIIYSRKRMEHNILYCSCALMCFQKCYFVTGNCYQNHSHLTKLNGYVLLVFSQEEWTNDTAAWMIGNSMLSLYPCGFLLSHHYIWANS